MRRSWRSIGACLWLLAGSAHAAEGECIRTLDLANRTLSQRIRADGDRPAQQKFVQIEVASVVNPKRIRLTFEVGFRPDGGATVRLGSFALFPPDNPGRFIVATGGKVGSEGAIVVSMVVLDDTGPGDDVRVRVKRLTFREK